LHDSYAFRVEEAQDSWKADVRQTPIRDMPERQTATPPTSQVLRAFFREQRMQSLVQAAGLLGWSRVTVRRRAREDDALLRGGFIPWSYVAAWVFETWSYEWVIRTLGADADDLLPVGLRAVPIVWYAPAWVMHGLNVQRQVEPLPHRTVRPKTLSEYLTDFLARGIDPTTVELLHGDPDFMAAYHFPDGGADA
jgi:hypothetical protein